MAIRALSGVIFTRGARTGTATIRFHPHEATVDGSGAVEGMTEAGPARAFSDVPCKHIALRQLTQRAQVTPLGTTVTFAIDDRIEVDALAIEWRTEGEGGLMSEISYLVIGDVPDA